MRLLRALLAGVFLAGSAFPANAARAVSLSAGRSAAAPAAIAPVSFGSSNLSLALSAPSPAIAGSLPSLSPAALQAPAEAAAAAAALPVSAPTAVRRTPSAVPAEATRAVSPREGAKALGKRLSGLRTRFEKLNGADEDGAAPSRGGADSGALLSRLFDQAFSENPDEYAALEEGLARAPFAGALSADANRKGILRDGFVRGFGSFFDAGAADQTESGRARRLKAWLAEDGKDARRKLAAMIARGSSPRSETWTYLFRDNEVWEQDFRRYLASRIAEKVRAGARELSLDSVGAAYGAEPYTLAIVVDEELRRAGEDPDAWSVRIRAFDKSFLSLVSVAMGFYADPAGGPYKIPDSASIRLRAETRRGRFTPTALPGVYRLRAGLSRWIEPVYVDLDDPLQHGSLRRSADAVFANYVLTHLRLRPAGDLAEWWLSGQWSDFGFLSMAQTLTAQVSSAGRLFGEGRPIGRKRSFLSRFAATVGAIGGMRAGDGYEASARWRDRLFAHPTKAGQGVFRARDAFLRRLNEDPFFYATVEPDMLAAVERLSAETGAYPVLTTDQVLVGKDSRTGEFLINAGWLMRTGQPAEERIKLLERLWRAQAPKEGTAPRGPPSGRTREGATLRLETIAGKPRLRWLSRRTLEPLSDAYTEDEATRRAASPGITVRF